nr:RNA-directed DNA polymerase, eukaryota, reverse transcriptase zinc-binding domain protein [Tanacetum cinerariifolium]
MKYLNESYVRLSPLTSKDYEDLIKGNNGNYHEDEDDDMFDDGSECNDFLHQGGGWIDDTCEDNVNGDFLKSSELVVEGILGATDNDANSTENPDTIIKQIIPNSSPGNNASTSNNDIKITKTIDVGTSIGYNMNGKEANFLDIIGDNLPKQPDNSPGHYPKKKISTYKSLIRLWKNRMVKKNECLFDSLMAKMKMLESKAENEGSNNEEIAKRLSCLKSIQELEHKENMDILQKGKIKWAIE